MYDRDSGGEPPLDVSAPATCCEQLEQSLRLSLEGRIVELEVRMAEREQQNAQYMTDLKECVIVRDEKILALNSEMNKRDELISELKLKLEKSEESVRKLTESVEELVAKLNSSTETVSVASTSDKSTSNTNSKGKANTKKKAVYKPLAMEEVFAPEPFIRFFVVSLPQAKKQSLCPFDLEQNLIDVLGGRPMTLSSSGADSLLVQVANKSQSDKIQNLSSLCEVQCVVKKHEFFNTARGLIYLYNTELTDINSFKSGLIDRYHLQSVEEATWIKTKNQNTKVFMISSYQDNLPEYLKIISESTMTKVYPYQDSPLRCRRCLKYGHTAKRCSSDVRCERCSGHHSADSCHEEDFKCFNCEGMHRAGSRECPTRKKEESILNMQKKMKTGRAEAMRLVEGGANNQTSPRTDNVCEYYEIKTKNEVLRKMCPFKTEKFLVDSLGISRENITIDKNNYIVKCENKAQSKKAANLKTILDIPCRFVLHENFNRSKGLIYTRNYSLAVAEQFLIKLKTRFDLFDAVVADWIKPRNEHTKPLLLTFNTSTPPNTIEIPGDRLKVYEYLPRPLFCRKCLEYSHTLKRCTNAQRCQKCSLAHKTDECQIESLKCFHCEGDHPAGSSKCIVQEREQQITLIRYREKVSWPEARQRYHRQFPNGKTNYARVTTGVANKISTESSDIPSRKSQNEIQVHTLANREPVGKMNERTESSVRETTEREKRRRNNSDEISQENARKKILTLLTADEAMTTDSDLESSETNQRVREEARKIFEEFPAINDEPVLRNYTSSS